MNIRNIGLSNSHQFPSQYTWSWTTKIKKLCHKHNMAILMILLWQCANNLMYYLLMQPSYAIQKKNSKVAIYFICFEAILSLLSPLTGLLADVVYGRFKVLIRSTYIMLASEILTLVVSIMMYAVVDTFNYTYYLSITLLGITLSSYYLGRVFFLTNVVQFGTDQIRDSPTQNSVLYIYIFFWSSNLSHLLSMTFSSIPHHEIRLTYHNNTINIDPTALYLLQVSLSMSAIFSIIILFIVQKHSDYFLTEYIMGNPYKLVYGVVRFAIKHKHPIKRSAFTYCNDERPSRLDYGKQSYGGPFTTEQVEDVKSLLHIVKVLISLGPAFLLDLTGLTIFRHHRYHQKHLSKNPYNIIFLENGILSPLLIAICIPCYLVLIKPFFSRYIPNMFKRMGLNIIMLNILFLLYIIVCSIDKYHIEPAPLQHHCSVNISHTMPMTLVDLSDVCMIFQHVLSSLHQMLLYIAAWEFICCQSPQHMKGLLFGLFYSIKAFFQLLAAVLSYLFFVFSCQLLGYFLFNLAIGLVSLVIFTVVARRYKYRKRDDICNIYQYAEDYYSNIK